MKRITLIVGLVVVVAMLSGCMMFDSSIDRSDGNDNNHGGHSHH